MKEMELKSLWQSTNEKLAESMHISKINTESIAQLKLLSQLNTMKPLKIFTILIGLIWVSVGAIVLFNIYSHAYETVNKFFLFSATIQVLLTALALCIYLYQLIEIYRIDVSTPVLVTQEKLVQLRISTLWSARILFLQLPLWTTFWWNDTMLEQWHWFQWAITICITIAFSTIALWIFFNLNYENRNRYWFQWLFKGNEWIPLQKSIDIIEQIKEMK